MYTCLARLSSFVSLITSLRISYATVETKLKEDANFLKIKSGTIFSSSSSSSFSWEGDETEKIFIGYSPMTYTHTHTQQPKLARYIIVLKDKEEKRRRRTFAVCVLLAAAAGCVKIRADRDSRDGHNRETTNYQSRDSFSRRVKTINKKGKRRKNLSLLLLLLPLCHGKVWGPQQFLISSLLFFSIFFLYTTTTT
jgi:hypothetical protein